MAAGREDTGEPYVASTFTKRRRDPLPLVRDGPDDRDSQTSLDERVRVAGDGGIEPAARVGDLDHEAVGIQLEEDLDGTVGVRVGVPDGVRARLGERELEVGERLVLERTKPCQPGQRQPPERDVFRLGRDGESNGPRLAGAVLG